MKGGNTTGLISHLKKHDEEFKKFDKAREAKEVERKKKAAKKRKGVEESSAGFKQPKLTFSNKSAADQIAQ